MPSSYSQDFQKKVITHVKKGNSYTSTATKFEIAVNTVRNWYMRYRSEGNYLPKKQEAKKSVLNFTMEDLPKQCLPVIHMN